MTTEMTLDEAINTLATLRALPRDALVWAKEHWEDVLPRTQALLEAVIDGSDRSEETTTACLFLLHLAGELHETRLHAQLCRLLQEPELPELVLSDGIGDSLPGILINSYADDPAPLQAVVEAADTDGFVRGAALLSLAWLTRAGRLTEDWMRGYLGGLYGTMQPQRAELVWAEWVTAVAALGYADLVPQAESLFRRGMVQPGVMALKDFREDLGATQRDPAGLAGFARINIAPFEDTIEFFGTWQFDYPDANAAAYAPQAPVVNPLRHVGRNDPCLCGSGKKYKKCCLAA